MTYGRNPYRFQRPLIVPLSRASSGASRDYGTVYKIRGCEPSPLSSFVRIRNMHSPPPPPPPPHPHPHPTPPHPHHNHLTNFGGNGQFSWCKKKTHWNSVKPWTHIICPTPKPNTTPFNWKRVSVGCRYECKRFVMSLLHSDLWFTTFLNIAIPMCRCLKNEIKDNYQLRPHSKMNAATLNNMQQRIVNKHEFRILCIG